MFIDDVRGYTGLSEEDGLLVKKRRLQTAREEGIITLADSRFFAGLALLYLSVQKNYPVPIVCFDGGLTESQKRWAAENMPACSVRSIPETEDIDRVRRCLHGTSPNLTEEWLLWICPMLLAESPFRRTLWLDSDLVVLRSCEALFRSIDDGPVFTLENHAPSRTANPPELYDLLPIERRFEREVPLINAGVSGWDLERDAELLAWYRYPVLRAAGDARIRAAINWHDQGSLIWALQKTGNEHRVLAGRDWNLCAKHAENPKCASYSTDAGLLDHLRTDYPSAKIVHWNGFQLPEKLASRLGSEAAVLEALRGMLPGEGHAAPAKAPRRKVKLISFVGVKSHVGLLEQFLDHYIRLGVDEFLLTLHGEDGDPRLDAARNVLSVRGVVPVRETQHYSAALKQRETVTILDTLCTPDDWVLFADVDELQVYLEELPHFLARCDRHGYAFVRGYMIDRVAEHGRLAPILPGGTLWAQFPYGAPVTQQITSGWTLKVCAMRGSFRPGDGGSHSFVYGSDEERNYVTTHRDTHGYPASIEIHHFKWDAGLLQRIEEKLKGTGGDHDAIEGVEFMHEYRLLYEHLKRYRRIAIEGLTYLGQPMLHYMRSSAELPLASEA